MPVQLGRGWTRQALFALQRRTPAADDKGLTNPPDSIHIDRQRAGDLLIGVSSLGVMRVAHEQNTSVDNPLGWT
jgi:hypothetical protein